MSQSPHDEFLELCALSTSGQLTREGEKRLHKHLEVCSSCRQAMEEYDAVVSTTIPSLAPDPGNIESDPSWSQEEAEAAFFQRLTLEEELGTDRGGTTGEPASKTLGRVPLSASQATWRNVWTLCAAGVLLVISLGILAYRIGIRRGTESASVLTPQDRATQNALQQQASDAGHDREVLRAEMAQRDKVIGELRHQLEQQSTEMGRMKLARTQLESDLQNGQAGRQELLQQQSELKQNLDAAQAKAQATQEKLDALERQAADDKKQATVLEAKLADLNFLLNEREGIIHKQQEVLARDHNIHDLVTARKLYVVDVYDINDIGNTKKPYGRMFYTQDTSVIFYAYDLDQQPGVKAANTFQAWGRRGPDWTDALNLGVFDMDNVSDKRWVLRLNDSKVLSQIDAVFVTVEPHGGSHKPTNKPLLFAYLHMDPNHP